MNELERICKEFRNCPSDGRGKHELICVKEKVEQYINEDKNNYLKLSAQVRLYNADNFDAFDRMVQTATIFGLILTMIDTVSNADKTMYALFALVVLLILLVLVWFNRFYRKTKEKTDIWVRYVEVVLEDIAKEKEWK